MKRIFISYCRQNIVFAERLARDLSDAGLEVWIDFRQIQGGEAWREAIFQGIAQSEIIIVCLSPAAVESEWVRREILMARSQHKFIVPSMITDCFDIMAKYDETKMLLDIQTVNFAQFGYEKAFPLLLNSLPGNNLQNLEDKVIDSATIPNPFKGLEAFQQTDAHLFFGRESLVQKMLDRLKNSRDNQFTAVVGASGSGKSSMVRAGLIPAIREGKLPDSDHFPLVIFAPGAHPIEAIATRLLPLIPGNRLLPEITTLLKQGKESLHLLAENILINLSPTTKIILVIDQFEEVFTRTNAVEAQQFLDLIHEAVTRPEGRTIVILTMRADYFGKLSSYPDIAALFERDNMVIVTEMNLPSLRRTIEEPAKVVGLIYEDGLVDQILDELHTQQGSLPLLQYALKELYERREGLYLTHKAYQAIGGIRQALAQHADGIYNALSTSQQGIMRRILLRLVNIDDFGEATRKRLNRNELTLTSASDTDVQAVIDVLTGPDTRLLTLNREIDISDEAKSEPIVWLQMSHEALIREWKQLADWIAENRAQIRYGIELNHLANEWMAADRNKDYLLFGRRLGQAEIWLETADASDTQKQYIRAATDIQKRQELRQYVFRQFALSFTAGSLALGFYTFVTFRSEAIFNAERWSRTISIGVIFGLTISLMIFFCDTLPRQILKGWPRWARFLLSAGAGISLSTLCWGAFTWQFLNFDPYWPLMLVGGIGLSLGFILSATFNLKGWVAFLITCVATYIPIYLLFDFYFNGTSNLIVSLLPQDLINNPQSLLYFDYYDQIFTIGIPVVIMIGLIGHGQWLWKDIQSWRKRFTSS